MPTSQDYTVVHCRAQREPTSNSQSILAIIIFSCPNVSSYYLTARITFTK